MVIVFSDIHFGSRRLKAERIGTMGAVVDGMRRGDTLILAGDVFDYWLYPKDTNIPVVAAAGFMTKVESARRRGIKVVYLFGNHDFDAPALNPIPTVPPVESYCFEQGGKSFMALHGHQFDPWNKGAPWYSRLLVAFQGVLELIGLRPKRKLTRWSFAEQATSRMFEEQKSRIMEALSGEFDVVVTGHTHRGAVEDRLYRSLDDFGNVEEFPITLANSGDVIDNGTYLEISRGKPVLKRLES